MFKTSFHRASKLMVDDHFKMGGRKYQIEKIVTNDHNQKVLHVRPTRGQRRPVTMLIVPRSTIFKVYNQK